MPYTTIPSGGQIQDFKVRNAVDAIKTNMDVLQQLVSINATVGTPVALTQGTATSYQADATTGSKYCSLSVATDLIALRLSLVNAGLIRP